VKLLPGRTENSVKNRFNCMFKKIREARLVERKDSNIQDALMKIEGVGDELLLDEDAMIRELIEEKIKEITDQGGVVRKVNDAEERK